MSKKIYVDEEQLNTLITRLDDIESKMTSIENCYPIGAIYLSTTAGNPSSLLGFGTWTQIKDTFLLAAGDKYSGGITGGSKNHQHDYGLQYGGYYRTIAMEQNPKAGLLNYDANNNITLSEEVTYEQNVNAPINDVLANKAVYNDASMHHYRHIASTSTESNLPPYLVVYIWKRTA